MNNTIYTLLHNGQVKFIGNKSTRDYMFNELKGEGLKNLTKETITFD